MQCNTSPYINMNNISLCFEDIDRPILQNVSYSISKGDFIILLGGNGSGKSSLIKILNKQYLPSLGSITMDPSLTQKNPGFLSISTLTQTLNESLFFDLTVFENCLLYFLNNKKMLFKRPTKKEKSFFQSYLHTYNSKLSTKLDVQVNKLSGGEKQALLLGLSLLKSPKLLLLDEHTSALDPKLAEQIIALTEKCVRANKLTCVMTTHNVDHALKYGDKIVALKGGRISFQANKAQKQLLTRETLLEQCY